MNAGSDTLTVFGVRRRPARPPPGRSPSGGRFPVSIAVHGDLVYVLNARDGGSIQGYRRVAGCLVPIAGSAPRARPRPAADPGVHPHARAGRVHPGRLASCSSPPRPTPTPSTCSPSAASAARRCRPAVNNRPPARCRSLSPSTRAAELRRRGRPERRGHLPARPPTARCTPIATAATGQAATCWIVRVGDRLYASNAGSGTLSGFGDGRAAARPRSGTTTTARARSTPPPPRTAASSTSRPAPPAASTRSASARTARSTPLGSVTVPGAVGGEGIAAG